MLKKIETFVKEKELIRDGDRIAAGFSGGADSVCLLLVLKELKRQYDFFFCAVHVEHGIRGEESLRDAEFARSFCEKEGIEFRLFPVDAQARAAAEGESLEEAARELRFGCLREACREFSCNKIALAHHAGDNAETVLFHLSRGTGTAGLCGIRAVRDNVIRPLLAVSRAEIEAYLSQRGQTFCTDSTNADVSYARNRIRNRILPELEEINGAAVRHIGQLSDTMEEICAFLSQEAFRRAEGGIRYPREEDSRICCVKKEPFAAMHPALQKQLILELLGDAAGSRKDLSLMHVEAVRKLFSAQVGKRVQLPYGLIAEAGYQEVLIKRQKPSNVHGAEEETAPELLPGTDLALPDGTTVRTKVFEFTGNCEEIPRDNCTKWFDYDKIAQILNIRTRRSGDYITVTAQGGRKKLRDYLIDEKIPRARRDQILLLAEGSHVLWVFGYRISEAYKVTGTTKHILEVCISGGRREEDNDRNRAGDDSGGRD